MKVHLIKKESVEEYVKKHVQARIPMSEFLAKLKYADWNEPADIKNTFPSSD